MKTYYKITEAHSGTSEQEISKAKEKFAEMLNTGQVYGSFETINIQFSDINGKIKAAFLNENGEKIAETITI